MLFGVPGLKRVLLSAALIVTAIAMASCGGGSSNNQPKVSGFPFRAFVSNSLFPSGSGTSPVLNIVNAAQDVLSRSVINMFSTPQPELMEVSPNLQYTIVFGFANNSISVVDNTTESIATGNGGPIPPISLPGFTESMFIAGDNATAYAAVPSAPVVGQAPGAVVVMSLLRGSVTATIPVPAARFIVPNGNQILVFSDNSDTVTVISTALIGVSDPLSYVTGFDRPVWAILSSDATTAYVFNCGLECGGRKAGITTLNMDTLTVGSTTPVSAATYGLLNGTTLYVAGTPPGTPCGAGTAATSCGKLSIINVGAMAVTASATITDGYHDRMQMGANGQLFIGSHSCTNINILGGEVRGCLSIFNTTTSAVVVPPQIGDATGIQPITGRTIVYVCEGGVFQIFDTTTDVLLVQDVPIPLDLVGQSYDVKLVDPPITNVNNPAP
jgi:hypothetical protein